MASFDQLREAASVHGFEVVGVSSGAPLVEALARLEHWCAAGHAADLHWMTREPPQRADPRTLLKRVRSVVSVAVPYGAAAPRFEAEGRYGRVARYAWGRDYHDVMLPRLEALAQDLARLLGAARTKVACDHSPILERAFAEQGGLGFLGKNACLIRPGSGSWFLLGEVLLDVEAPAVPIGHGTGAAGSGCGACRRCLVACPTQAFVGPFELDARRCISYWTIETHGPLPRELRERFGAWVFGCDDCQDVCPYNGLDPLERWPELAPAAGVGQRLDLAETLALADDAAFEARFRGTPLLRPGREGLLRSAAVAARNVGATGAWDALVERVRHDPAPVVRSHALWALAGLDAAKARELLEAGRRDASVEVRDEAACLLA